jgi:hypothetical protein
MQAAKQLLDSAYQTIAGDRRASYGDVQTSFDRVAKCWSAILNQPVTASQVCLCMTALQLCREANAPKQDNRLDAVGYLALLEELESHQPASQPPEPPPTFCDFCKKVTPTFYFDQAAKYGCRTCGSLGEKYQPTSTTYAS